MKTYSLFCILILISSSTLYSQSTTDFWTVGISAGVSSPVGNYNNHDPATALTIFDTGQLPMEKFNFIRENHGYASHGMYFNFSIMNSTLKGFSIGINSGYSFNTINQTAVKTLNNLVNLEASGPRRGGEGAFEIDSYKSFFSDFLVTKNFEFKNIVLRIGPTIGGLYMQYPFYDEIYWGFLGPDFPSSKDDPLLIISNSLVSDLRSPRSISYGALLQVDIFDLDKISIGVDISYKRAPNLTYLTAEGRLVPRDGFVFPPQRNDEIVDKIPYEVLLIGVSLKYALGG